MTIPAKKIYPRTMDKQTVYLDAVVTNPAIEIGAYTMYNDFVNDPVDFEKNNVCLLYTSLPPGVNFKSRKKCGINKS